MIPDDAIEIDAGIDASAELGDRCIRVQSIYGNAFATNCEEVAGLIETHGADRREGRGMGGNSAQGTRRADLVDGDTPDRDRCHG